MPGRGPRGLLLWVQKARPSLLTGGRAPSAGGGAAETPAGRPGEGTGHQMPPGQQPEAWARLAPGEPLVVPGLWRTAEEASESWDPGREAGSPGVRFGDPVESPDLRVSSVHLLRRHLVVRTRRGC